MRTQHGLTPIRTWTIRLGLSAVVGLSCASPGHAENVQSAACAGRMRNGWSYVAHETGHRFREIVWDRSGVRQLVSKLEYAGDNELAQRVYRGSLFDASVQVVLVEVASSSPAVPHRVSVGVEEWGWSRARCTTAPP